MRRIDRLIELLRLKPVWLVLLAASLAGAFFVARCSKTELPEGPSGLSPRPEPTELVRVKGAEEGGNSFDQQCREFLYEMQGCMLPFPQSGGEEEIPANNEREVSTPQPPQSPQPIVQLRPLRKKQRIAPPPVKSVQRDFSELLSRNDLADLSTCAGGLIPAVQATVASLEARSILYGVGPLSDCSGIFHRVLMGVKKRYPDYDYPSFQSYRDSREIARWYHERGELILVRNAVLQSDLIRPGMVLFYGRTGVRYKNPSVSTLLSPRYGIYHVGVVVRVFRDKAGKVSGYELFHGHGSRGRTKASITRWHQRTPTRAGYPPFGNGRQQLVAAARIIRPVKKGDVKKLGGQNAGSR